MNDHKGAADGAVTNPPGPELSAAPSFQVVVSDARRDPASPWSQPCEVCEQAGTEVLCGACRAPLHGRCFKTHADNSCPAPNSRNNGRHLSPLEAKAARGHQITE